MYLLLSLSWYILIKKREQCPSQGDKANTAEAAPGRVGRGEQSEARRANTIPNGGPHFDLGRTFIPLKTSSKSDFSMIAETANTSMHIRINSRSRAYTRKIMAQVFVLLWRNTLSNHGKNVGQVFVRGRIALTVQRMDFPSIRQNLFVFVLVRKLDISPDVFSHVYTCKVFQMSTSNSIAMHI